MSDIKTSKKALKTDDNMYPCPNIDCGKIFHYHSQCNCHMKKPEYKKLPDLYEETPDGFKCSNFEKTIKKRGNLSRLKSKQKGSNANAPRLVPSSRTTLIFQDFPLYFQYSLLETLPLPNVYDNSLQFILNSSSCTPQ